jgi:hypothetical protein
MRLIPLAAIAALTLSACEMPPPAPAPDPGLEGNCGAAEIQGMVGQRVSALGGMSFPGPVRVIRPGDVVTMDFLPSRLNVELDRRERIIRLFCG